MAKITLEAWLKDTDERRAWYGGHEIDGAFSSVGTVYDGIWRVRLAERFGEGAEFQAVRDQYVLVDVEEGPYPSSEWYDWFYEQQAQSNADGRAEMTALASWSLSDEEGQALVVDGVPVSADDVRRMIAQYKALKSQLMREVRSHNRTRSKLRRLQHELSDCGETSAFRLTPKGRSFLAADRRQ